MRATKDIRPNWVLRLLAAARARDLSRRLRLPVLVHDLGWRSTEIEVAIVRRNDGSIAPVRVLTGPAAIDLLMLDKERVHGRFVRYNGVVSQLRYLAKQLADLEREGRVAPRPGSPLAYARATLTTLDELVACRERAAMGRGAVRLATLDLEITFFARYYAWLAPIVESVTGSAPISMARRRERRRDRRLERSS